jgi:transcriptional regulator with XRE-family HTH domain
MARDRPYSPYARDAVRLLGQRIQLARRERRWSEQELADRAGINRTTLRKVERGDMGVGIGLAFDVATLLGLPLFHEDHARVTADIDAAGSVLALMPRQVKPRRQDVKDDF